MWNIRDYFFGRHLRKSHHYVKRVGRCRRCKKRYLTWVSLKDSTRDKLIALYREYCETCLEKMD